MQKKWTLSPLVWSVNKHVLEMSGVVCRIIFVFFLSKPILLFKGWVRSGSCIGGHFIGRLTSWVRFLICRYLGNPFSKCVTWGGHKLSGARLDTEKAPSNIIWILFDYIFFRIKRALFILFKILDTCPPPHAPPVPTPPAKVQIYETGYFYCNLL